jgi:hypothetical protein
MWFNTVVFLPLALRQGTRTRLGCSCTTSLFCLQHEKTEMAACGGRGKVVIKTRSVLTNYGGAIARPKGRGLSPHDRKCPPYAG